MGSHPNLRQAPTFFDLWFVHPRPFGLLLVDAALFWRGLKAAGPVMASTWTG